MSDRAGQERHIRRKIVGIIGDGSLDPDADEAKMQLAEEVGRRLVDEGYRVACGGRGGSMLAACRGARASATYREGDTIGILPGSRHGAANDFVDIVIPTSLGHARNGVVAQSDAIVAIGGGAGTLSEMCFAWMHNRLIVACEVDGWSGRLAGSKLDERTRFPHIDDDRLHAAQSADEVVTIVKQRLSEYQVG